MTVNEQTTGGIVNEVAAEAWRLMCAIVAEKGADYVYPEDEKRAPDDACQYLTYDVDGRPVGPSCIVGHYLVRKGVPLDKIAGCEGESASRVLDRLQVPAASLADAFDGAQDVQDNGHPWGEALSQFEQELGL